MLLRKNKIIIFLTNALLGFIFCLPVILAGLNKKKRSESIRKILILELWGIGDLVMMSSALKSLDNAFPRAKIALLSKEPGKALFEKDPCMDEVITFDFPWTSFKGKYKICNWDWAGLRKVIARLRKENFDLILDARGDIRNNLLSFLIGGKRRIGYNWTSGGYFLTDVISSVSRDRHRVDSWIGILKYLNIENTDARPHLHISEEQEKSCDDFLRRYDIEDGSLLVGIHPGGAVKLRCWQLERFAEVAVHVRNVHKGKIFVFIEPGGFGENIPIEGDFIKVRVPLLDLPGFIKKMDLLICNDSSAMHIATAVGTDVITIFGPGDVNLIGPYSHGRAEVVMKDNVDCRPCFDHCKYDNHFCLNEVKVNEVIEAAERAINRVSDRRERLKAYGPV